MNELHDDDTEHGSGEPPTVQRIALRALALCGVTCRALLEMDPPDDAPERFAELPEWLLEAGAWGELEESERALVETPLGALSSRDRLDAGWRAEGLAVLVWYLGLASLPPHDVETNPFDLWDACDFLGPTPPRIFTSAKPRGAAELGRLNRQLIGVHWRLRDHARTREARDFLAMTKSKWFFGAMDIEGLAFVDNDLGAAGHALAKAPPEQVQRMTNIVSERHRATQWLSGQAALYSAVTTET
jgi:hypothetical protein